MEGPLVDIPAWSGLKICDSLDNDNVMPSYVCSMLAKIWIQFLIHLQIVIEFIKFGNVLC